MSSTSDFDSQADSVSDEEYNFNNINNDQEEEVKQQEVEKPVETKEHKKQQKKPKTRAKEIKQVFNPKFLTHSLNNFYGDYKFKDYAMIKDNKENNKIIIDINNYKALDEFKQTVESIEEQENRSGTKMKEADKWNTITHSIWNFKLRGILTAVNDNYMKKKTEDGTFDTSLFSDHLISQLEMDTIDEFDAKSIIGNIAEFLTSDKFKFKLYNSMFPHPMISQNAVSEKGEHLNKIYLQNISKYHDDYLKLLYSHKVSLEKDLFKFACDNIIKDNDISNKLTTDVLMNANYKNINESFSKEERTEFDSIIKLAKYEKTVAERYFKCYNLALEQNMISKADSTKLYKSYIGTIKTFRELSKSIINSDVSTLEKFVNVFVDTYKKADEFMKYKTSINNFIKDIDCQKKLMFTQRFKQILTKIIEEDKTLHVEYSGKTFKADFLKKDGNKAAISGDIIQEEKNTFNSVYDSLGKIGLIGGNKVRKDIRVGIGIGLIDYVISEVKIIEGRKKKPANDKRQRKIIYIKA